MKILVTLILILSIFNLCFSQQSFNAIFKVYDFRNTEPGFNLNYTNALSQNYPQNGLVKTELKPNKKPEYCCGNQPYSFIDNEQVFDKSFMDTTASKSFNIDITLNKVTKQSYYTYDANINPFYPANGKGWNENVSGNNLFWCMEGHFKFYYVNVQGPFFNFEGSGDYSVFLNNTLVMQNSAVPYKNSAINIKGALGNLDYNQWVPVDVFYCQRFADGPAPRIYFSIGYPLTCVNYPGINDDVCPYIPPPCNPLTDCDDGDFCTIDACPGSDVIVPPSASVSDYCSHTPNTCNDNISCTEDFCDSDIGVCINTPYNNLCNDSNICTSDSCGSNGCVFTQIQCNDQNACTIDTCGQNGCTYTPISCDDNNACTADSCNPSSGCSNIPITCDDGISCTNNSCSPTSGCVYTPINFLCEDDNVCTVDSCDINGGCKHTPISCDDGKNCTYDSCDSFLGCQHIPSNSLCNDNNACTNDICSVSQGCIYSTISCDDSNDCTTNTCDPSTGCKFVPNDLLCNDNIECTIDKCSTSYGGCIHIENNSHCSDNVSCTVDVCSSADGCHNIQNDLACDDSNLCTIDKCTATGCAFQPVDCPPKKILLGIGLVCINQKCDISTGNCVDNGILLVC